MDAFWARAFRMVRMNWLVGFGVLISMTVVGQHAVRTKDWRPFVATLVAGFIGLLAGFFALTFAESAKVGSTLYVAGASTIASFLWWLIHPVSWHSAWDRIVSHAGSLQMAISYLILFAACLYAIAWLVR